MEIENVLYSLIPLVLIVVFSWLFSLMGSRMKKEQQDESISSTEFPQDRSLDIFSEEEDEEWLVPGQEAAQEPSGQFPHARPVEVTNRHGLQAPDITPEPIRPKWWGA